MTLYMYDLQLVDMEIYTNLFSYLDPFDNYGLEIYMYVSLVGYRSYYSAARK